GYGGHGIGRQMHMDPFLPNEGAPGRGPGLAPGSVLAIEPMLTLGTTETIVLGDEWTVVTADGSRAAHWEHTVAVTEDGPRVLTPEGSQEADGRRWVPGTNDQALRGVARRPSGLRGCRRR